MQQIRATSNQDDWQSRPRCLNGSRKLEPIHEGHCDIRDEAVDLREDSTLEQRGGAVKEAHFVVRRVQQNFERLENPLVIVDHGNDSAMVFGHGHAGILADRCTGRL